jgi:molybdenum cofactor synthesis domain-containing protein
MPTPAHTASVLTVSDSSAMGSRPDLSGPAVANALRSKGFHVITTEVVPDELHQIQAALIRMAEVSQLVVTTGGTGIAPRDVTPEATLAVATRMIEGIAERMRAEGMRKTPFAALSRALCVVRGTSIIVNLPGSPAAALDSLESVIELLPHALELLRGNTAHNRP